MYFEFFRRSEARNVPTTSGKINRSQNATPNHFNNDNMQQQNQQEQSSNQDGNTEKSKNQIEHNKNYENTQKFNENSHEIGQVSYKMAFKINKQQKSLKVRKLNERLTICERISDIFNCIKKNDSKPNRTVTLPIVEFDTEGDMPMKQQEFTNDFNELKNDNNETQVIENEKVQKLKHYMKITIKFLFSQMGLACLVIGYVILGSIIFMKIEKDYEKQNQERIEMNREEFYRDVRTSAEYIVNEYLKTHFHTKYNQYRNEELYGNLDVSTSTPLAQLSEEQLLIDDEIESNSTSSTKRIVYIKDKLRYPVNDLSRASWAIRIDEEKFRHEMSHHLKIFLNENDKLDDKDSSPNAQQEVWTYSSALLYSATVITTIGYGNITPKSSIGKVFTMFYAMIGIPLMFMCLTNTGDLLAELFITLYSKSIRLVYRLTCKHKLKMHYSAGKYDEKKESMLSEYESEYDNPQDKHVPIMATIGVLSAYIFSGAVIFSYWENWSYLDGAYFCFITFTTIGFGDFVPGKNTLSTDKGGKAVLCCLYLLAGMIIMAMCFKLMQDEVFSKARWLGKKFGIVD